MQRINTDVRTFGLPLDGAQLVTPIKSSRKELNEPIELPVPSARTTTIVRTGCIPCLSKGIRCGPQCHSNAVSQVWRVNSDLSPAYHGTWKERKGLHAFIDLALAPQRMGMMGSYFWKGTAMQACHNHPAVFHVASGIGSLQNHILDSSADSKRNLQSALAFALQQCNKAIRLLTQAANSTTMSHGDPGVAFIVCVLFVCFEALYGDHGEALTHAYQGQRLLRSCEQFVSGWEGASVVDPQTARPVLAGLQLQAKCMLGPSSPKLSGWQTGLSPLPKLSTIRSLEHANKTLRVVYSNLLTYHQDYVTGHTLGTISYNVAQKQARFVPWLRQWESSFAEYLFKEAGGLSPDDMSRAKVLKATHLLAMILAQVDNAAGWDAWRPFENEFKAIIDLAAAVLDSQQFGHVSEFEGLHYFPCMSFGLWVNEPLFVCMSRCTNPEYRRQAAGLLNGIPRSARKGQVQEPPKKITAKSKSSNSSSGRASASSHDDEKPLCGPNAVGLDMGRLAPYFDRLSPPYEEPWH